MEISNNPCPCGSSLAYPTCCGVYISGEKQAPSPEALMRSRYTAFCLQDLAYIRKTWHKETLPELSQDEPSQWVGLEILGVGEDNDIGQVEFRAKLIYDGKLEILHELSDFEKVDGCWVYHSGEFKNENSQPKKIARKEPCPCGSGKVFKHCHGSNK